MKYKIKERDFKGLGYQFTKLYANNYKCYHKNFGAYNIWCFVKGKQIEVNDYYHQTEIVIDYFNKNKDNHINKNAGNVRFYLNRRTGQTKDYHTNPFFYTTKEFYKEWREIYLQISLFQKIVDEVNKITNGDN